MKVYSLQEFRAFTPARPTLGLFGNPVEHSLSPSLHRALFRSSESPETEYILIKPEPEEFAEAVALAREKLIGFNCTIPFKQAVIPFLDVAVPNVSALGSCNTVSVRNGKLYGDTTDGEGFSSALSLKGISLTDARVLLLGCGGAALSIAPEIAEQGAKEIVCAARNLEKAAAFCARMNETCKTNIFSPSFLSETNGSFDILVNTTPVGMSETQDQSPIDLDKIQNLSFVYDCIYNPPMPKLLKDADARGILWDNGLSMLALQGAAAQTRWFDRAFEPVTLQTVLNSLSAEFAKKRLSDVHQKNNLVLIGFMGSGKTTIGKQLASSLGMNFVDLDEKIEKEQDTSIPEIFKNKGEDFFRELETNACRDLSNMKNTVIATGGGTILREENRNLLKSSGLVLLLNPELAQIKEHLKGCTNRPLLQVSDADTQIHNLYTKRMPLYEEAADIKIAFPNGISDPTAHVISHI